MRVHSYIVHKSQDLSHLAGILNVWEITKVTLIYWQNNFNPFWSLPILVSVNQKVQKCGRQFLEGLAAQETSFYIRDNDEVGLHGVLWPWACQHEIWDHWTFNDRMIIEIGKSPVSIPSKFSISFSKLLLKHPCGSRDSHKCQKFEMFWQECHTMTCGMIVLCIPGKYNTFFPMNLTFGSIHAKNLNSVGFQAKLFFSSKLCIYSI